MMSTANPTRRIGMPHAKIQQPENALEPVQIMSSTVVTPANPSTRNSSHKTDLTPFDMPLLLLDYVYRGMLFRKPTEAQEKELGNAIDHLKASFALALDVFPPFAGRLAVTENEDQTTSFCLDCNDAGATFVHAVSRCLSMADILEPLYLPSAIIRSFFTMNGVYNCEGISKPLLAVQVTELVDGIFIGFTYNHAIADGTSFWHFVNTWSAISARAQAEMQPRPVQPYWFLEGIDHPIRISNFSYHDAVSTRLVSPPLLERVFHFSKEKIAALKAKAVAEIGGTSHKISSLQAILGHLWQSIIRHRYLDADQEIHCRVLINLRRRLQPTLPEKYFGNVVYFGTASTTAGELLGHGVGWSALLINKMVAQQTNEEARKNLERLQATMTKLQKLDATSSNALIVASSPRFNLYGNNFGWGCPVAVRGGTGNTCDGKITVFPGVIEGSVDIQACLAPDVLQAMENDPAFMEAIC